MILNDSKINVIFPQINPSSPSSLSLFFFSSNVTLIAKKEENNSDE